MGLKVWDRKLSKKIEDDKKQEEELKEHLEA
jgi:hypothetical protein